MCNSSYTTFHEQKELCLNQTHCITIASLQWTRIYMYLLCKTLRVHHVAAGYTWVLWFWTRFKLSGIEWVRCRLHMPNRLQSEWTFTWNATVAPVAPVLSEIHYFQWLAPYRLFTALSHKLCSVCEVHQCKVDPPRMPVGLCHFTKNTQYTSILCW